MKYDELVNALRHCVDPDTTCDGCPRNGNNGLCADVLYRVAAAAIEVLQAENEKLQEECKNLFTACSDCEYLKKIREELEPKRGEWEQVGDNTYKCTNCGEISCCKGKYCPDCGAKMEVQDADK